MSTAIAETRWNFPTIQLALGIVLWFFMGSLFVGGRKSLTRWSYRIYQLG